MGIEGVEWDRMGIEGVEWERMGTEGVEWDRMGIEGVEWERMGIEGVEWERMGIEGVEWERMGIEGAEWESARVGPRQRPPASSCPPRPQPQFPRGILDECVAVRNKRPLVCVSALILKDILCSII
jgi:hypothetical protein